MAITMYSASIPTVQHILRSLMHVLDKGEAHAQARKIDPAALTQFRLAPDMLPFTRQILIACDGAKLGVARIAGIEAPKFDDTEVSFADLKARVQKTLDFLATVTPEAMNGTEDKDITFPISRDKTRTMKAEDYLRHWMLPNVFFHVVTAYDILRHNGVELGKSDYLRGSQA
ncbi:DUF1993 domain-containing protein [Ramlibacter sp.]|uniref:DUF1993 domain-containing protein n=1 Tax=Ramlibacter sp. TaxID=1917967 RepID=UPI0018196A0E|nr:DUF1993 domain-containing protein [Ramlibacter sp.]MBA2675155.1 DUF1993 domain-containing protein [Ramlibacter sp.]